jgi:hypothetical protein
METVQSPPFAALLRRYRRLVTRLRNASRTSAASLSGHRVAHKTARGTPVAYRRARWHSSASAYCMVSRWPPVLLDQRARLEA